MSQMQARWLQTLSPQVKSFYFTSVFLISAMCRDCTAALALVSSTRPHPSAGHLFVTYRYENLYSYVASYVVTPLRLLGARHCFLPYIFDR